MTRTRARGEAKRWPSLELAGVFVASLARVVVGRVEVLLEWAAVRLYQ